MLSILTIAPDLNVRLDALAARVKALLSAHDADFARAGGVLTYLSDAVTDARSRAERLAVTAASPTRPERLCEIAWLGDDDRAVERLLSGEPVDARDRVRLYLTWGVRLGTDDAADAARAFRAALRGTDPAAPGLAAALRAEGFVAHTDADTGDVWEVEVRDVAVERAAYYAVDLKNREWRHEAAVTLTLTGAPLG